jgi:hypothetical protein
MFIKGLHTFTMVNLFNFIKNIINTVNLDAYSCIAWHILMISEIGIVLKSSPIQ